MLKTPVLFLREIQSQICVNVDRIIYIFSHNNFRQTGSLACPPILPNIFKIEKKIVKYRA